MLLTAWPCCLRRPIVSSRLANCRRSCSSLRPSWRSLFSIFWSIRPISSRKDCLRFEMVPKPDWVRERRSAPVHGRYKPRIEPITSKEFSNFFRLLSQYRVELVLTQLDSAFSRHLHAQVVESGDAAADPVLWILDELGDAHLHRFRAEADRHRKVFVVSVLSSILFCVWMKVRTSFMALTKSPILVLTASRFSFTVRATCRPGDVPLAQHPRSHPVCTSVTVLLATSNSKPSTLTTPCFWLQQLLSK